MNKRPRKATNKRGGAIRIQQKENTSFNKPDLFCELPLWYQRRVSNSFGAQPVPTMFDLAKNMTQCKLCHLFFFRRPLRLFFSLSSSSSSFTDPTKGEKKRGSLPRAGIHTFLNLSFSRPHPSFCEVPRVGKTCDPSVRRPRNDDDDDEDKSELDQRPAVAAVFEVCRQPGNEGDTVLQTSERVRRRRQPWRKKEKKHAFPPLSSSTIFPAAFDSRLF